MPSLHGWRHVAAAQPRGGRAGSSSAYIDELRGIAEQIGLTVSSFNASGPMVHLYLDTDATGGGGIRIKVETNIGACRPSKAPPRSSSSL